MPLLAVSGMKHMNLTQHHEKYEEIHGEDKIVLMSESEHRKLHIRLREQNKCNIPPEELADISIKAHRRTDKYITRTKEFWRTYRADRYKWIGFCETIEPYVYLIEEINYDEKLGTLNIHSFFRTISNKRLYELAEKGMILR